MPLGEPIPKSDDHLGPAAAIDRGSDATGQRSLGIAGGASELSGNRVSQQVVDGTGVTAEGEMHMRVDQAREQGCARRLDEPTRVETVMAPLDDGKDALTSHDDVVALHQFAVRQHEPARADGPRVTVPTGTARPWGALTCNHCELLMSEGARAGSAEARCG